MNLVSDFDKSCAANAARCALVWNEPSGEEKTLTYAQLEDKTRRAAAGFRAKGIGKGDAVAIVHRNDPAFIVAYFGLLRLGAVAVPINFMISKPEELTYLLGHCRAKGVVTQRPFLPGILAAKKSLPNLSAVWISDAAGASDIESFWSMVDASDPLQGAAAAAPDDTVMVLYTSGTTGAAKGVELTHKNLVTNCDTTTKAVALTGDDVWIALLPMFHTFCWTACVLMPLRLGAKIAVAVNVAPPEPWLAQMKKHQVTVLATVPQVWALLANDAAGYPKLVKAGGFLEKVRTCISGAAPLNQQIHDSIKKTFGLEIIEGYGLTETSPVAALNPLGGVRVGSVGVAIDGVSIRAVDPEGEELEVGEEGELQIKGPNVMKGYLHDPKATNEAITPDGWFRTGDIGVVDDEGYVYICDRIKDMIIVKGLKVFPAQLEAKLVTHPAVAEAAVIGLPDDTGDEMIKAYLVLKPGVAAGPEDFRDFCRDNFDAYKRPKLIEIVPELPRNAMRKVLKRVLREQELAKRKAAAV